MSTPLPSSVDVAVVGAGNAAFCAGLAAAEQGVSVLMLERALEEEAGGNSRFTAGAFRCVYNGVEDLRALMPDLTDEEVSKSDFGTYTEEKFFDDMGRVTEYRTDPELCEILVTRSKETMLWMRDNSAKALETIKAYNKAVMSDVQVRPEYQGWPRYPRACHSEVELGQHNR